MEALAGLSIAANVMQVITFTRETYSLCKKIYRKQVIDPDLAKRVAEIQGLGEDLESKLSKSTPALNQSPKPSIKSQLPNLCNEVVSTAKELGTRLSQPASSKREAVKFAVRTAFRGSSEMDTLDKKLLRLEQTLQTRLLLEIWSKQDAALVQQHQGFATLDQAVKDYIQKCAEGQIRLQDVLRKDLLQEIAKLSDVFQDTLSIGFDKTIQHVTQIAESSERVQNRRREKERLLHSVRFPARNARKSAVNKAYEKTFEWIFDAPGDGGHINFREWIICDDKPIFWIQGKPGSGKSTLMKFLISSERTSKLLGSKYPNSAVYSHFIWMADKQVDGTVRGMLCSLIHQILEVDTNDYFVEMLLQNHPEAQRRQSPHDWEMDELRLILQKLLESHKGFVILFIDGLDELDASDDKFRLKEFAESILSKTKNLKLCISSRPDPEEKLLLSNFPSIKLQDLTKHDLAIVTQETLSKYFEFTLRDISDVERGGLVERIVQKAQGVFLWITLALTRLRKGFIACDTLDQLLESLEDTPSELNDLYRKMWDRLGPGQKRYREDAAVVFKCLLEWQNITSIGQDMLAFHLTICREKAPRSMLQELMRGKMNYYRSQAFLNACINNQRQVESHCAGLIEFVEYDTYRKPSFFTDIAEDDPRILRVDFIHRSLRDFFLEDGQRLLDQPNVEGVYAKIFNALIGQLMIDTGRRKGRFLRFPRSSLELGPYKDQIWLQWHWESHASLTSLLICCRIWMDYSKRLCLEKKTTANSWGNLSQQNLSLLASCCKNQGVTYLLEEMALHLDDVTPTIEAPFAPHSLSTYLIWSRLDSAFLKLIYDPYWLKHTNDQRILQLADLDWAYMHTITGPCHVIPQLERLPESMIVNGYMYWKNEELLLLLRHLRQYPIKFVLGSAFFIEELGEALGARIGVNLAGTRNTDSECYEVIFRINAAVVVNCFIKRALFSNCENMDTPWTLPQQKILESILCPEPEEMVEVLLVGLYHESFNSESHPVRFFDQGRFQHLLNDDFTHGIDLEHYGRHSRYFAPSKSQSNAIISNLSPDFLMNDLRGPSDACLCDVCADQNRLRDDASKEKLARLKQRREDRVNAIKRIITEVSKGDSEHIYDILEHIRNQGHYIPTEDDVLEFLEAKGTFERVAVLDRLNREKAEKESWMFES
ncbi:hypothetical protein N0V90_000082 [Kalmusia sp. IMI 367209]|nr:hypothetical protein N0V90_000082 [Kalmusia sp. IMI 367209]